MAEEGKRDGGGDQDTPHAHYYVFTAHKAGMDKVDQEKVNQVVHEMSKNSRYYRNAQRHGERQEKKIAEVQAALAKLSPAERAGASLRVSKMISEFEAIRCTNRVWGVIDADMFFAAVEMRDDPSLQGKPIAVGGMSMISTANYEARRYGVRSAMPGFIAVKLCPHLIFVHHHGEKYRQAAMEMREIYAEYDPEFSAMSLDEAYLDLTAYVEDIVRGKRTLQDPNAALKLGLDPRVDIPVELSEESECDNEQGIADQEEDGMEISETSGNNRRAAIASAVMEEIRARVFQRTKLTCSAGIAVNAKLAKMASDINKPNGQFTVPFHRKGMLDFLDPKPVRKLPGVGKVTEHLLTSLGVHTIGDVRKHPVELCVALTDLHLRWLVRSSLGVARTEKEDDDTEGLGRKSMSVERTFRVIHRPSELIAKLSDLCQKLSEDLKKKGIKGKNFTLKLKTSGFEVRTRQTMLQSYTNEAGDMMVAGQRLLEKEIEDTAPNALSLRLMGTPAISKNSIESYLGPFQESKRQRVESQPQQRIGVAEAAAPSGTPPNKEDSRQMLQEGNRQHQPSAQLQAETKAAPRPPKNAFTTLMSQATGKKKQPKPAGRLVQCPLCGKLIPCNPSQPPDAAVNQHLDAGCA